MRNGLSDLPLYRVWVHMKERCNNPKNKRFKHYGARGIKVCDEWEHSYRKFEEWAMANGYKTGLSIDRIDNDKGYSPENCKWSTYVEQNRNRGNYNRLITYNGKTQCIAAWAEEVGLTDSALRVRIKKGVPIERALNPAKMSRWDVEVDPR